MEEVEPPKRRLRIRRKSADGEHRELPIYILPNLFTTGNLFCGFFSVIKTFQGEYLFSAYWILAAMLFDVVDGRVARLTNSTTKFGMEYDSLSDVVSFGVAPAVLMYFWSLLPYGRVGWLVSFLYLACGAMRLARFNVQANQSTGDKTYFKGLPIPGAAGVIASAIVFHNELGLEYYRSPFMLLVTFSVAYFMVSTIKFRSFKDFDLRSHAFSKLVGSVVVLIGIASSPEIGLFVVMVYYVAMNVVVHLWKMIRKTDKAVPAKALTPNEKP